MRILKNIAPAFSGITAIIGGILIAFGNDYGIIGLIPALIYTINTNKNC